MKVETVAALIACFLSVAGVLIYIGRSLGTLDSIAKAVDVALKKTDRHDQEIQELKTALTEVRTRQEDCGNCP